MSNFTDAVGRYCDGLRVAPGAAPGCDRCLDLPEGASAEEPGDDWCDLASEPSFSWSSCDSCGSTLGGDRYPAHGIDDEGRVYHLDICTDCVMFHANGDEPDPEAWR
ncbi:MAG: hypothetical protein ACODAA_00845 [Gemmatimonadota bacterium]